MNDNDNYLSLGNLFRVIKEISKNTSNSVQSELFCILFDLESINNTTVNNYCVGSRSIGNIYKQKYLNFQKNDIVFEDIFINLINTMEGKRHQVIEKQEFINNNELFHILVDKMFLITKNDSNISTDFVNKISNLINSKDYYHAFRELLYYIVLENKQPLFCDEQIKETINDLINKTNISLNDIRDILEIEFCEGLSYYRSLLTLAEKDNPYALYKLARMEYLGEVSGQKNIEKCFKYLKRAAEFNHPASLWMIAHLMLKKEIFNEVNYNVVWKYLEKAKEYGSVASLNTMGICYLRGWTIDGKIDEEKALSCFNEAMRKNYVYSINNLGKYYEDKKDLKKAFEYYLLSADMNDSWACNKVGEIYRINNQLDKAFEYYNKAINSSLREICPYAWYNLAKYFYLDGNSELLIVKNEKLANEYLNKYKNAI